jgi:sugar phosphate permease
MERVGAALWGLMAGAAATGQGVGEAGILFAGGFIITGAGFPAYFLTVAAVALVGALCLWLVVPGDPAAQGEAPMQPRKENTDG